MKARAKLDSDITLVGQSIVNFSTQFGFDFLPLLVIRSEKKSDILRINSLPETEIAVTDMFKKIGSVVAGAIDDADTFIMVCQTAPDAIALVVKSVESGMSRILDISLSNGKKTDDSGWLEKQANKDFYAKPNLENLEDLWCEYKFRLIVKK